MLLVQDVETRWNSTYLPNAEKIEKLKTSLQNYVGNNKFKPKNIFTAYECKLVSLLDELLELFYIITQQCRTTHAAVV